ncbi:predicted protein [Streptomyces sp. C]|nr:predicted protein [Streptomyces sp. C]
MPPRAGAAGVKSARPTSDSATPTPGRTATSLAGPCTTFSCFIRRSLHLDSKLGEKTIDALLDMALPPSAKPSES